MASRSPRRAFAGCRQNQGSASGERWASGVGGLPESAKTGERREEIHFHERLFPCNLSGRLSLLRCVTQNVRDGQTDTLRAHTSGLPSASTPQARSKNHEEPSECTASDGGPLRPDRRNLRCGPDRQPRHGEATSAKAAKAGLRYTSQDKDTSKHSCKGKNDCKGQGGGCKGKNSCKGKGGCATDGPPKSVETRPQPLARQEFSCPHLLPRHRSLLPRTVHFNELLLTNCRLLSAGH